MRRLRQSRSSCASPTSACRWGGRSQRMSLRLCPTSAPDVLLPVPSAPRPVGSTTMSAEQNDQVLVALRNAARDLAQRRSIRDLEETLRQIVASAVDSIPGVDAGSISITEHG